MNPVRWVVSGISTLAGVVPLRVSYAASASVAAGMYALWRRGRENQVANLRHVLGPDVPEAQVRRVARQAMRNFCRTAVEFLRLPSMNEEEIARVVGQRAEGEEHGLALRDAGRGILLVSLHFGAWDLGGLAVLDRGVPLYLVVDDYGGAGLNTLMQSFRTRPGFHLVPVRSMAMRQVYRRLGEGGVLVATAFDVPASLDDGGIPVQFFDGTAVVSPGPARLALRTGAAVTTGVYVRHPDGLFKGWFKPPIEIQPTGDEERDIRTLTQAIACECEEFIRQYPDQWYIFRPLWIYTLAEEDGC
jgi:lauroyl/myristoyl acyltransferase